MKHLICLLVSSAYVSASQFAMVEETADDSSRLANLVDAMSDIYKHEHRVQTMVNKETVA